MQERRRLGETLRAARLANGVSLDEAAAATRISRSALHALETEDFNALPAPVYTRGLLINYARYLGLPTDDVVAEYVRQQSARVEALEPEPEESGRESSLPILRIFLGIGLAIVLGLILVFVWREFLSAGPAPDATADEPTVAPTAVQTPRVQLPPLRTPSPVPSPSPPPTPAPTPITGVNLSLSATTQRVWLQVWTDDVVVYVGTIGPETDQGTDPLVWNADESIVVLFGRAGGIELNLNGQDLEPLSESQDPITFEAAKTEAGELAVTVSVNGTPVPYGTPAPSAE